MFVAANLMTHQIRMTDVRVERLQDISDEDCLKEGIIYSKEYALPYGFMDIKAPNRVFFYYDNPREAFAHLINKVSRKDVWILNPYVFVYDFKLVKSHSL